MNDPVCWKRWCRFDVKFSSMRNVCVLLVIRKAFGSFSNSFWCVQSYVPLVIICLEGYTLVGVV
jgi:hypothetical protein